MTPSPPSSNVSSRGNATGPMIAALTASSLVALLLTLVPGPALPGSPPEDDRIRKDPQRTTRDARFASIVPPTGLDPAVVALGRKLFHDPRLSRDQTVSCASCHEIARGGDDGLEVSIGIEGRRGSVNAPTVLNSALNVAQFWDGRAATLEEQVDGPVHHPAEMDSNWAEVLERLSEDPAVVESFQEAFGGPATPERLRLAIATFERSLSTPGAPFDRWLEGDDDALSATQLEGLKSFCQRGCVACHQGAGLGGNQFQRLGLLRAYFVDERAVEPRDLGRFNHTRKERDRFVFRVPSLRNVGLTAPYFHDGSAASLEEAVRVMLEHQAGVYAIDEAEVRNLVAFLQALTGDLPGDAE